MKSPAKHTPHRDHHSSASNATWALMALAVRSARTGGFAVVTCTALPSGIENDEVNSRHHKISSGSASLSGVTQEVLAPLSGG